MRYVNFGLIISLLSLTVAAGRGQDKDGKRDTVQKEDSCTIPFSAIIPGLEQDIKEKTPEKSALRAAALKLIATRLKTTELMAFPKKSLRQGIREKMEFKPNYKGRFTDSGITWTWELEAGVGEVEVFSKATPVFARFILDCRLNISTDNPRVSPRFFQAVSEPDRWFYIVEGRGKRQDGTTAPKNAPATKTEKEGS